MLNWKMQKRARTHTHTQQNKNKTNDTVLSRYRYNNRYAFYSMNRHVKNKNKHIDIICEQMLNKQTKKKRNEKSE